jgi:hypothetical protein
MKEYNIYRLLNGKTTGSFQLPIRSEMIDKIVDGEAVAKRIVYIPGAGTIYLEDYKGDQKPKSIWFEDGFIHAPKNNKELNEILQKHSWYGKHYELVDEEKTAEAEMKKLLSATEAANAVLNETDDDKIKAMAMIMLSEDAATWGPVRCKGKLLEYAHKNPEKLLFEMNKDNYQSRYLAAVAFNKGIVKYNSHRTAVVWGDTGGKIISVAAGETGVEKLGEFLSTETENSVIVLQTIGEKMTIKSGKLDIGTSAPVKTEAELRAEIEAEMEAKYKEKYANLQPEPGEVNSSAKKKKDSGKPE